MIFRWLDRLVSCGSPTQWQRVHASLVIFYLINVPLCLLFTWWFVFGDQDKPLIVQLTTITVLTAVESSMAGLHASAVQERQEADDD